MSDRHTKKARLGNRRITSNNGLKRVIDTHEFAVLSF
jgi:hypothetical protein